MISILIAEANTLLRKSYKKILGEAFGNTIYLDIASSGSEALEKIKKGQIYDLVILDIGMFVAESITVAKDIRNLGFKQPILAHTALGIQEVQEAISDGYMDGFTIKTGDARHLINIIKKF